MHKIIFSFLIFFSCLLNGQNAIGFIDNYAGIQNISFNPANIADSFYKIDINIFSSNLNIGNDATSFNPFKIIEDIDFKVNKFKNVDDYLKSSNFSKNSNYYVNATVLGPSILWNINRKSTFAISTVVRASGSVYNIDSNTYDKASSDFYLNNPLELLNVDFNSIEGSGSIYSWAEVGFTYASIFKQNARETFKYGISLKFLRGLQTYSFSLDDIDSNTNIGSLEDLDITAEISGTVNINSSTKGTNYGQAIDFGFVYEKRNRTLAVNLKDREGVYYSKAPYQYKLSASITDLGFLTFNNVINQTNSFNLNFPFDSFKIEDYLDINNFGESKKETFLLPTTAHLNVDYNLSLHWFVNTNIDLFLLSRKNTNQIQSVSNLTISPRFESQYFSAFMPMSINRFGIFKAGLGFRTSYFFIGSSSFITNLTNLSKEADVFLGFKIPIFNKKVVKEFKDRFKYHVVK